MKYAVFTYYGYGLPIAKRLAEEGNTVLVGRVGDHRDIASAFQKKVKKPSDESRRRRMSQFEGMLPIEPAEQLLQMLRKENCRDEWFVFFDLNHLFRLAGEIQELGVNGNFPTEDDFCYELDRDRAKDFVDKNYPLLRVGQKKRFSNIARAKKFMESNEELWVLKALREDSRTVVPDVTDPELARGQIMDALIHEKDAFESGGFILELFIREAMELTPAKVYCDGKPVYTCMCIENKPMGSGNIGPMTDCAQDIVFRTEFADRINTIAFPEAVDRMAENRKGVFYWDASLYLDPRSGKIYFGEFCANRPGYNSLYTEIALSGSASRYFESVAAGKNPHPDNQVAASVRIFNYHRDDRGRSLAGGTIQFKDRIASDLWLWDAKCRGNRLETCGYVDTVGVVTGRGHSVSDATRSAYKAIDDFSFEGSYYRPQFDFLSREYQSSILNRLNQGLERGLYKVGFGVE